SVHPGFAKNKMQNALKIAAKVISSLPQERLSPESTSGKEGFIHPTNVSGAVEKAIIEFIIRDHDTKNLTRYANELEQIIKTTIADYPGSTYTLDIHEQYRNMKEILDQHPQVMEI